MDTVNTPTLGAEDFRDLMAGFPSGIAVLTARDTDGRPAGLTCTALCAVSVDPPLLLVSIHSRSRTLRAVEATRAFAVNLLHHEGRAAAEVFSGRHHDRFGSVAWRPLGAARLPSLVEHAHTVARCHARTSTVAGDHTVVIAEVTEVHRLNERPPLLYGLRAYAAWPQARVEEEVAGAERP